MSYYACQSRLAKDGLYHYNLKLDRMTSKMQDIYFPRHAQLSLYGIFPRENVMLYMEVKSHINKDMENKHKYIFSMFTEHVASNQSGASHGAFHNSCISTLWVPTKCFWCCISVCSCTVGGQIKGQQFTLQN